jgi:hypothetical protein
VIEQNARIFQLEVCVQKNSGRFHPKFVGGGIHSRSLFHPPHLKVEAKRTISSFSLVPILKINPDISKSKSFFFSLSKPISNINIYYHHLENNYWDNN